MRFTDEEWAWWRTHFPFALREELENLSAPLRQEIATVFRHLDWYRDEFAREERQAWDRYAASKGHFTAADLLLSERRKRFPRQ